MSNTYLALVILFDNPPDKGQAKSPTSFFSAEPGFEHPVDVFRLYAAAIVLKDNLYKLALGQEIQPDVNDARLAANCVHAILK